MQYPVKNKRNEVLLYITKFNEVFFIQGELIKCEEFMMILVQPLAKDQTACTLVQITYVNLQQIMSQQAPTANGSAIRM